MLINLIDLISLSNDEKLSQKYLKYYLGYKAPKQYRHEEILTIKKMIESLNLGYDEMSGFTYSFILPHLNKELDLIKVTKNAVINIELKSARVSDAKIIHQLKQNKYYLHLIHKPLYQYTYVMTENIFYKMENDALVEASLQEVRKILQSHKKAINIDLNTIFKPENIFASPLYMTDRFIANDYLLTDSEQLVERQILKLLEENEDIIVQGSSGSGKTMVLYDTVRRLQDVIVISPYYLDSFKQLNKSFNNFKTISIEEFTSLEGFKYCFIDEANRFKLEELEMINKLAKKNQISIVFFLDNKDNQLDSQELAYILNETNNILKLTSPIRASKEALGFIDSLFYHKKYFNYNKYKIIYVKKEFLTNKIEEYVKKGFTFISYEDNESQSDYAYKIYTKRAYPYEFQKIVMCIDEHFYLDEKLHLKSIQNEEGIYYTRLLYQGLTRAREEIVVLVTNEKILNDLVDALS